MTNKDLYMDDYYKLHYRDGLKVRDLVPQDVAALSADHWLDFPPQHPFIADVVGILFGVLTLMNFLGNGTTIYLFIKESSLRKPSNYLIVNLAVLDMLMILSNGVPLTYNVFHHNYWMYGKFWCTAYGLSGAITGLGALWTLIFIGYDRYNTIVGGFASTPMGTVKALAFILFSIAYPVAITIWPTLEIWSRWSLEGLLVSCSFEYSTDDWNNKSFTIFIFSCCYVVPMCFIIYYYSFIVKAVWSHEAAMKEQAKKMNVESLRQNANPSEESAEMKIAKVALTNVLLWYMTWTPYAAVVMIGQFGNRALITPFVSQVPSIMTKVTSCLNPIVFATSHPKFREAMRKHMPCMRQKQDIPATSTTADKA